MRLKFGCVSGLELGSDNFQPYRIFEMLKTFQEKNVRFIILAGGLTAPPEEKQLNIKKIESDAETIRRYLQELNYIVRGKLIKFYVRLSKALDKHLENEISVIRRLSRILPIVVMQSPFLKIETKVYNWIYVKGPDRISPFVSKVASTPIETDIFYELSQVEKPSGKFLGVIGGYGTAIYEWKPRSLPAPLQFPYVSIPSLHRRILKSHLIHNISGYAIVGIDEDIEVEFYFPQYDEAEIKGTIEFYKDSIDPKLLEAILELQKSSIHVTLGIIEDKTGIPRDRIAKAFRKLGNDNRIIPRFERLAIPGELKSKRMLFTACLHIGDIDVDTERFVKEIKSICKRENIMEVFIVGDIIGGVKHNRAEKGLCRSDLMSNILQEEKAAEILRELAISLPEVRFIIIPGNHDEWTRESIIEVVSQINRNMDLLNLIGVYHKPAYEKIKAIVDKGSVESLMILREKLSDLNNIVILNNPSSYEDVYLLHEHMGGAKSSTLKIENAFSRIGESQILALGNYHELTTLIKRIKKIVVGVNLGTWKTFSEYESVRSKHPETGMAFLEIGYANSDIVRVRVYYAATR